MKTLRTLYRGTVHKPYRLYRYGREYECWTIKLHMYVFACHFSLHCHHPQLLLSLKLFNLFISPYSSQYPRMRVDSPQRYYSAKSLTNDLQSMTSPLSRGLQHCDQQTWLNETFTEQCGNSTAAINPLRESVLIPVINKFHPNSMPQLNDAPITNINRDPVSIYIYYPCVSGFH